MDGLCERNVAFVLQAVVVSIDPRRVYLKDPKDVEFKTVKVRNLGKAVNSLDSCFMLLTFWLNKENLGKTPLQRNMLACSHLGLKKPSLSEIDFM